MPLPVSLQRRRRLVLALALAALLAAMAAAGFGILKDTLIGPRLAAYLQHAIGETLDMEAAIGPVTGSYLGGIDIAHIRLDARNDLAPLQRVTTGPVTVRYFLPLLFKGTAAFIGQTHVSVKGARVAVRLAGNGAASDEPLAPMAAAALLKDLPPLPSVHLTGASLTVHGSAGSGTLGPVSLELDAPWGKPRLAVGIAGGRWSSEAGATRLPAAVFTLAVTEDGLRLDPLDIAEGLLTAAAQIDLSRTDGSAPFTVAGRLAGTPVAVEGVIGPAGTRATLSARGVDLDAVTRESGLALPQSVSGRLDVTAQLDIAADAPSAMTGSLSLALTDGAYGRFGIFQAAVALHIDETALHITHAEVAGPSNRLTVEALRLPMAALMAGDVEALAASASGRFALEGTDAAALLRLGTGAPPAADLPTHGYRLAGSLDGAIAAIAEGSLTVGGGSLRVHPSTVRLPRPLTDMDTAVLNIRAGVDLPDLLPLSRILSLTPPLSGSVRGQVAVTGTPESPEGRLTLQTGPLRLDGRPMGALTASAAVAGGVLTIQTLKWQSGKDRIRIDGGFHIPERRAKAVVADFSVTDPLGYLPDAVMETIPAAVRRLALTGTMTGTAGFDGPLSAPRRFLNLRLSDLKAGGRALGDLTLKARFDGGRIDIERGLLVNGKDQIRIAGAFDTAGDRFDGVRLDFSLTDVAPYLSLLTAGPPALHGDLAAALSVSGRWPMPVARLTATSRRLDTAAGSLTGLSLTATAGPGRRIRVTGLEVTLAGTRLTAGGDLAVSEALDSAVLTLGAFTIAQGGHDLRLAAPTTLNWQKGGRLALAPLTLDGAGGTRIRISGGIPVQADRVAILPAAPISVQVDINLPEAAVLNVFTGENRITGGRLSAAATIAGTWQNPEASVRVDGERLTLESAGLPLPPGPLAVSARARYLDRNIRVDHCRINAPSVVVTGKGFIENLVVPWAAGPAADGAAIDMDLSATAEGLEWLAAHIPSVRSTGGRLSATAHLKGPLNRPAITASLSVSDGHVRAEGRLPAIDALNLKMTLSGDELAIAEFSALLGGAPFTITGTVAGVTAPEPTMDLQLAGDNLLLYRDPGLRVRGNTALRLAGPLSRMQLTGNVALTDGLFSHHLDILSSLRTPGAPATAGRTGLRLFSIRQSPVNGMRLDIGLTATRPFVVRSNLVRGEMTPNLRLTGTAEVPLLVGSVLVTTAQIRLPAGRMIFENGVIQFPNDDPERPVLHLVGTSKMFGYDVQMLAEGPYDEPDITLSAAPMLASEDILLMLLTGAAPSTATTGADLQRRSLNVTMFIGQDLLSRWFSSGDDTGESILERFDVQLGREITQKGEETVEAAFRLTDKVFGDRGTLYLTGEKDVYDYYNAGVRLVFRLR